MLITDNSNVTNGENKIESKANLILETENLVKVYEMGDIEVPALRGINLSINKGEMISIMGASGSGKTTLLNLLGGLDTPTEGRVLLENVDISTMSDKQLTQIRRHKIGFIFQSYNLLPVLTAFENIELPMLIAGIPSEERKTRTEDLLKIVGLEDRKNHKPDELSGGQKQRVAIARSLANRPAILLCDEPTGDLDSETGDSIMNLLEELNQSESQTILIVTHDSVIGKRTQKTYHISDGTIEKIEIH